MDKNLIGAISKIPAWVWVIGAVGIVLVVVNSKKVGETAAKTAVGGVDGMISGTVKGLGAMIGIPETDKERCRAAKAAGKFWKSTAYCSAGDLILGVD
ncbi:MAG: hypothetical protein KGZ83_13365 [Sulfuricella sp.]|nr:hypothetical protein [Sulfuricella sp.]